MSKGLSEHFSDDFDAEAWLTLLAQLEKKNQAVVDELRDQTVVVVLGPRGGGKSALQHYLAGSVFRSNGRGFELSHAASGLEKCRVGSQQGSRTRNLMTFKLSDAVFVDCPGESWGSGEINIATAVALMNAAKICKRLRFAVVISCASLIDVHMLHIVAEHIGQVVENFEDCHNAFTFLFSHVQRLPSFKEGPDAVRAELRDGVQAALEETGDDLVHLVVSKMLQSIDDRMNFELFYTGSDTRYTLSREDLLSRLLPNRDDYFIAHPSQMVRRHLTKFNERLLRSRLDELLESMQFAVDGRKLDQVCKQREILRTVSDIMPDGVHLVKRFSETAARLISTAADKIAAEALELVERGTDAEQSTFTSAEVKIYVEYLGHLCALEAGAECTMLDEKLTQRLEECGAVVRGIREDQKDMINWPQVIGCLQRLQAWAEAGVAVAKDVYAKATKKLHDVIVNLEYSASQEELPLAIFRLEHLARHKDSLEAHVATDLIRCVTLDGSHGDYLCQMVGEQRVEVEQSLSEALDRLVQLSTSPMADADMKQDRAMREFEDRYTSFLGIVSIAECLENPSHHLVRRIRGELDSLLSFFIQKLRPHLEAGQDSIAEASVAGWDLPQLKASTLIVKYMLSLVEGVEGAEVAGAPIAEVILQFQTHVACIRCAVNDLVSKVMTSLRFAPDDVNLGEVRLLHSFLWFDDGANEPEGAISVATCLSSVTAVLENTRRADEAALQVGLGQTPVDSSRLRACWTRLQQLRSCQDLMPSLAAGSEDYDEELRHIISSRTRMDRQHVSITPDSIAMLKSEHVVEWQRVVDLRNDLAFLPFVREAPHDDSEIASRLLAELRALTRDMHDRQEPFRGLCHVLRVLSGLPATLAEDFVSKDDIKTSLLRCAEAHGSDGEDKLAVLEGYVRDVEEICPEGIADSVIETVKMRMKIVSEHNSMIESDISKELKEAIDNFDFGHLVWRLQPVRGEKENAKRLANLQLIAHAIESHHHQLIESLRDLAGQPPDLQMMRAVVDRYVQGVQVLHRVNEQVGKLLVDAGKVDVKTLEADLREHLNRKGDEISDRLESACDRSEYGVMFEYKNRCAVFQKVAVPILSDKTQTRFEQAQQSAETKCDSLKGLHRRVVDSVASLPQTKQALDVAVLSRELKRLADDDASPAARDLYEDCRKGLVDACRDLDKKLAVEVEQSKRFSEALLICELLKDALDAGLSDHVPATDFSIADTFHRLRRSQDADDDGLRDSLLSLNLNQLQAQADQMQLLLPAGSGHRSVGELLLDKFSGPVQHEANEGRGRLKGWLRETVGKAKAELKNAGFFSSSSPVPCEEYQRKQSILNNWLRDTMGKTEMELRTEQFDAAACDILAGAVVWRIFSDHVPDKESFERSWLQLARTCTNMFHECINDVTESLSESKVDDLSKRVARLRSFMNHATSALQHTAFQSLGPEFEDIVNESEGELLQMHESFARFVEVCWRDFKEHCDSLDFKQTKASFLTLRKISNVVCHQFAAYLDDRRVTNSFEDGLQHFCTLIEQFGWRGAAEDGKHTAILGLPPSASGEAVEQQFAILASQYDPDRRRIKSPWDDARLAQIKASHSVLMSQARLDVDLDRDVMARLTSNIDTSMDQFEVCVEKHLRKGAFPEVQELLQTLPGLEDLLSACAPNRSAAAFNEKIFKLVRREAAAVSAHGEELWEKKELQALQDQLDKMSSMSTCFSRFQGLSMRDCDERRERLRASVQAEIKQHAELARSKFSESKEDSIKDVVTELLHIERLSDNLKDFSSVSKEATQGFLDQVQEQTDGFSYFFKLGKELMSSSQASGSKDDDRLGKKIVDKFSHFESVRTVVFNQQTIATHKNVDASLAQMQSFRLKDDFSPEEVTGLLTEKLKDGYERYSKEYTSLFGDWFVGKLSEDSIRQKADELVRDLPTGNADEWSADEWPQVVKDIIPELLAHIFVLFTIIKSGESYRRLAGTEMRGGDCELLLLKPHSVQIIAILHLLGFDCRTEQLKNRIMEVATGEGKSIILGGLAATCAFLGRSVRCICYSGYLNRRDFKFFQKLFKILGVIDRIKYSTISEFSEYRIRLKGDLRRLTQDFFEGRLAGATGSVRRRLKRLKAAREILLFDEVDAGTDDKFFSKTHNPIVLVKNAFVFNIFRFLWDTRETNSTWQLSQQALEEHDDYKALLESYPDCTELLKRECLKMCMDVHCYDTPQFRFDPEQQKVGYPHMDTYSYDSWHGYRTTFAYLAMASEGKLTNEEATLKANLKLQISCGSFAFTNIGDPIILGVSGTVGSLGPCSWKILKEYGIESYSTLPSVFGDSKFEYGTPEMVVSNDNDHFRDIADRMQTLTSVRRAVIVFMEPSMLEEFKRSDHFRALQCNILDKTLDDAEKERIIKKAATPKQMTVATWEFSRGSDFFCDDKGLEEAGGVEVVCTYVPVDMSAEIQLVRRGARQGKRGTATFILKESEVAALEVDPESLRAGTPFGDRLKKLHEARDKRREATFESLWKKKPAADRLDALSNEYFDHLLAGDAAAARAALERLHTFDPNSDS